MSHTSRNLQVIVRPVTLELKQCINMSGVDQKTKINGARTLTAHIFAMQEGAILQPQKL